MTATRPEMKPYVAAIHAYVPGKSAGADGKPLIKLSANENPLGTSPAALKARREAPGPDRYPDPDSTALRRVLGELHGIDPARIVCGTGSDELLNLAAQAYAGAGDNIVHVRYGFAVYDIATRRCGAEVRIAPDKDFGTDVDALLGCVDANTRVVFLANPNNPTGTYLPAAELARLHAELPADVLLVLDHAYAEYLPDGMDDGGMALASQAENVLVTRTFSKIYGLAGERIGWGTGAPHIIDALNRIRGPFNVTLAGQAAAEAAVRDQDFVRASRDHNAAIRAQFVAAIEALGNHGLRAVPSEANFVLVLFEGALAAEAALEGIAEAGYAVRHLPGQGLGQGLRITVGTAEQMDAIASTLRRLCEATG
ncbi:MAG: histidinol-phosphate transaminase [Erythrobacter sp.]|nr:MAG: histidinol-phosphate transaminase [Erythrobacter sp.]